MSYGYYRDGHVLDELVGKEIAKIFWSEDRIVFETTENTSHAFEVEGDCCSYSYFHDFFGVEHLLNNGEVTEIGDVDLADDDPRFKNPANNRPDGMDYDHPDYWKYDECVQVYGYKLVTVHPLFGEVTSVLSFRNSSNGYYGGWMDRTDVVDTDGLTELTEDFLGD